MHPAIHKDRLWSHLVWPLLWPLLLAQLLLVLLCLAVGLFLWLATPDPTSWAASGWLLLTLLVGTTLTTAAFLLQLRHRLRECEAQMEEGLGRVERLLLEADQILPCWLAPPVLAVSDLDSPNARLEKLQTNVAQLHARLRQAPDLGGLLMSVSRPALLLYQGRIVAANIAIERLMGVRAEGLESPETRLRSMPVRDGEPIEMQVLDAEERWRQLEVERFEAGDYQLLLFDDLRDRLPQLGGLVAARERAREDSRLKSRYLTLLQRELEPLLTELTEQMQKPDCLAPGHLTELRERMAEVTLLVKSLAGDGIAHESPDGSLVSTPALPLRVLVVDDGPVNRMLASQVLEGQGFEVDCVSSGQEALDRRPLQAYDLVLMDIYMPDMDGLEAARRWRELEAGDPEGSRSVLVALTANASEEDRRRFREAGMDDYLAKPYGPRALIDLLRHWRPDAFDVPASS
ncbi:response regulator [Halomonas sp. ANAO-440]|uniref:response regulator n=1 Tax=Halomonas sp. ANAO-440 TaxID=2861360 RepID=UPI001CAA68A2|nr:response regulator [Halomonas sp. ANAO-440]MBZ0328757.1 response regulator [Halomonas sp. ANAO-440]